MASFVVPVLIGALLAGAALAGAGLLGLLAPEGAPPVLDVRMNGDVVTPGSEVSYRVGDIVRVDLTGSYDPDGAIVFWAVDFGDDHAEGGDSIAEAVIGHAYTVPGVYDLRAGVRDAAGHGVALTPPVKVRVVEPDARLVTPPGDVGGQLHPIIHTASTSPTVAEPVSFEIGNVDASRVRVVRWEFGDGRTLVQAVLTPVEHTYDKAGSYLIKVRVEARDGRVGVDRMSVSVGYRGEVIEPPAVEGASAVLFILTGRGCVAPSASPLPSVCVDPLLLDPRAGGDATDGRIAPGASQARFGLQILDGEGRPLSVAAAAVVVHDIEWVLTEPPRGPYPESVDRGDMRFEPSSRTFWSPIFGYADDPVMLRSIAATFAVELDGVLEEKGYTRDGYLILDRVDLTDSVHYAG